ncbi:twin-arginine translocation signal domain-containing protein [Ferruginivarius sediminum]|uniref:Tat (Twin-arginine translocation) pathway signal sequence n=1 Tax=Ferruginivarius sediminum TaxID=2661937 RepID=A0A369TDX6_9PROT|nr:twin-arginine translocation signal domain-containing protein [Ferruginivarius sediminum]RDD63478.1 tat (twin-arginine translocation) pathway signal sequence [Ferruginivarius sediminum]
MERRIKGMNRRQFLQTSGLTAAGTAFAAPLLTAADRAWAIELSGALDQHTADTLLKMVRRLYPHSTLSDIYYGYVVEDLDRAAKSDEQVAKLLKDGVKKLDRALQIDFLDLSDGYQLKVLEGMSDSAFFEKVRSTTIVSLYNQELVWRHFGYEGASYPYGGYINRGFDDLAWLPEPPAEASPPKQS